MVSRCWLNICFREEPGASPKDSTMYILVAKDVNGCTGSDTVSVHVLKKTGCPCISRGKDLCRAVCHT
jgi:hypothetical protein